jgi:phosphoribosylformylglycinamidine cyclo-ligase
MSQQYRKAGVDIDAGEALVEQIRGAVEATQGPAVLGGLGGFAAHIVPDLAQFPNPVLVTGADGVGTKLHLAIEAHALEGIGTDLVAMCANDIACSGATPLFFLDYLATGTLDPAYHGTVIRGIAQACQNIGCALVGGETAEMPGFYAGTTFDLAGFIVGIVNRDAIIDGAQIAPGHQLIGIASSGFHSNGYSHLRHVMTEQALSLESPMPGTDDTLGECALTPTQLYAPLIARLLPDLPIHGIAHITGGGLTGNIPRMFSTACRAVIDWHGWELPAPFAWVQRAASLPDEELRQIYNCGVGLVLSVPATHAPAVIEAAQATDFPARIIGEVAARAADGDPIVYV